MKQPTFNVNTKETLRGELDELLGKFVEEHSVEGAIPTEVLIAVFETGIAMTAGSKVMLEDRGTTKSHLDEAQEAMEKKQRKDMEAGIGFAKALFG